MIVRVNNVYNSNYFGVMKTIIWIFLIGLTLGPIPIELPVRHLDEGIYWIMVETADNRTGVKFIVAR